MNNKVLESRYEYRFRSEGIPFPIHCLLVHAPQSQTNIIQPHYHDYIEILYSIISDADVYINGTLTTFNTGDLLIINSGESHDLLFSRGTASYVVIKVLPEILYSSEQPIFEMKYTMPFIIQNSNNKRHFTKKELSDRYIHDTVTRIMNEWLTKDYGYELSIRADVLKLFLWVLRYWRDNGLDELDRFDYSNETLKAIQLALEYTANNYTDITTEQVAMYCNLSYSYFSRTFKKVMGQGFSEYLTNFRITKAEQMLCTTDMSIVEIAREVGFSTSSYFIQQFKAKKNISPSKYRHNLLNHAK